MVRPGMAYRCTPNAGMKKLWITSVLLVRMRIFLSDWNHQLIVDIEQAELAGLQILIMDISAFDIDIALVGIGNSQYH